MGAQRARRQAGTSLASRIRRKVQRAWLRAIDPILYSELALHILEGRRAFPNEPRRIAVAIPNYERPELLHVSLRNILGDERVSEINILDDGSSLESFESCVRLLRPFRERVRLFRRDKHLGGFVTKVQVVGLCGEPWCLLLDSDNTVFRSYLSSIFALPAWRSDTIYCPGYPIPVHDFRGYGDANFDFDAMCALGGRQQKGKLLNNGNYFLNVGAYTTRLKPYAVFMPRVADSIFATYLWLSEGGNLRVLPAASYYHRDHAKTTWRAHPEQARPNMIRLLERFDQGMRASRENLNGQFDRADQEPSMDDIREYSL